MKNKYTGTEFLKTIYSFIMTKLITPQARIIRRPVYIRGKGYIGGKNLTTGRCCRFDLPDERKSLLIGDNCEIGDYTHIVALKDVQIGNNVLIASKVFISDTSHGNYKGLYQCHPNISPKKRPLNSKSIIIGNNVWIGENAVILAGVKIGNGCIIGANSVVNRDIPENVIAAGIPAKIIKRFHDEELCWKRIK